jgi:hypothetical protein
LFSQLPSNHPTVEHRSVFSWWQQFRSQSSTTVRALQSVQGQPHLNVVPNPSFHRPARKAAQVGEFRRLEFLDNSLNVHTMYL